METTMALSEVRGALGDRVDAAHYRDEHTVITKNGQPRAVIVSHDTYLELLARTEQAT